MATAAAGGMATPTIADLPLRPLVLIAQHLDARDVRALGATCRRLRAQAASLAPHARPAKLPETRVQLPEGLPADSPRGYSLSRDGLYVAFRVRYDAASLLPRGPESGPPTREESAYAYLYSALTPNAHHLFVGEIGAVVQPTEVPPEAVTGPHRFSRGPDDSLAFIGPDHAACMLTCDGRRCIGFIRRAPPLDHSATVASGTARYLIHLRDNTIRFRHGKAQAELAAPMRATTSRFKWFAVSEDLTRAAALDDAGNITVWDTHSGDVLLDFNPTGPRQKVHSVQLSADGALLVATVRTRINPAIDNDAVCAWDVASGRHGAVYSHNVECIVSLPPRLAVRGATVLAAFYDGHIVLMDARTGKSRLLGAIPTRITAECNPADAALSRDLARATVIANDGVIHKWDLVGEAARLRRSRPQKPAAAAAAE